MTPPFWRQAAAIAARDLVVEGRTREVLLIALPFGAVALFLAPFAFGLELALLAAIGPPLYWVVGLLFGMQITYRSTSTEAESWSDLLALLGVDPAARFVGRAFASGLLITGFLVVLAAVMIGLYAPGTLPPIPGMALTVVLFAAGLAMLGSIASDITVGLRTRTLLAPLLVAPLAAPLLIAANSLWRSLAQETGILTWTLILFAIDLVLALSGVLSARPLMEASR